MISELNSPAGLSLWPMRHPGCYQRQRTVRGQSDWLGLLCRTLVCPTPSRFIPALSLSPLVTRPPLRGGSGRGQQGDFALGVEGLSRFSSKVSKTPPPSFGHLHPSGGVKSIGGCVLLWAQVASAGRGFCDGCIQIGCQRATGTREVSRLLFVCIVAFSARVERVKSQEPEERQGAGGRGQGAGGRGQGAGGRGQGQGAGSGEQGAQICPRCFLTYPFLVAATFSAPIMSAATEDVLQRITEFWPIFACALHVVIALCVSSDIVLRKRDTRAALGWIGVVWLTPLLGTSLYFVFGVNRIRRAAQARRAHLPEIEVVPADDVVGAESVLLKCGPSRQHLVALAKLVGEVTGAGYVVETLFSHSSRATSHIRRCLRPSIRPAAQLLSPRTSFVAIKPDNYLSTLSPVPLNVESTCGC